MTATEAFLDRLFSQMEGATAFAKSPHKLPIKYFDRAHIFCSNLEGFSDFIADVSEGMRFLAPGVILPNEFPKLDISMVTNLKGSGGFVLSRHRRVDAKQVRGRVLAIRPYMVEESTFFVAEQWQRNLQNVGRKWLGGSDVSYTGWQQIGPSDARTLMGRGPATLHENELVNVQMAFSLCATEYLDWTVAIGYEGVPSVVFTTDPLGVREIFRLRDLPPGKMRRAALLHWVRGHWRKRRKDPGEVKVEEYMRGSQVFTWNGLRCEIRPSQEELEFGKQ